MCLTQKQGYVRRAPQFLIPKHLHDRSRLAESRVNFTKNPTAIQPRLEKGLIKDAMRSFSLSWNYLLNISPKSWYHVGMPWQATTTI